MSNSGLITAEGIALSASMKERPIEVAAIGSLVLEQVVRIDRWPHKGGQDVVPVSKMVMTAGGCAVNVTCFLGRYGAHSAVISSIGGGRYGEPVQRELEASNVDLRFLVKHPESEGSLIIILSNPEGDWAVLDYMDDQLRLQLKDIPSVEELAECKILHIDGFSFDSAGSEEAIGLALERAKKAGCLISVDGAVPAAARHVEFLRFLFSQADIVFANEYEGLRATVADSIEDAINGFQKMGIKAVFLKLGARGSLVITPASVQEIPSFEVAVADTVAAGDAYIATTLLLLLRGRSLVDAAVRGSAAGALACLGYGSLSSRFDLDDVENLVERGSRKS